MILTTGSQRILFYCHARKVAENFRQFLFSFCEPDYYQVLFSRLNLIFNSQPDSLVRFLGVSKRKIKLPEYIKKKVSSYKQERISLPSTLRWSWSYNYTEPYGLIAVKNNRKSKPYFDLVSGSFRTGILAFFFLFLSFSTINAQEFKAGVSGGISMSQVEGDGLAGYNKAGVTFGLFVNTLIREDLTAQLEINYSPKGSQRKTSLEDPRYYRMELNYIELPVILKYILPVNFTVEAGLSGGYLFSSKEKDELGEIPVSHPFRKSEIAALAGISRLITDNISLNLRISYSLLPIRKHAGGGTYYFNRGQNNNVISITAGYQF